MTRWAIVADLNRCVGCQTCTVACKQANATAPGVQWRKVIDFEVGEFPDVRRAFMPVGCMHCEDPPCMDVCPTTATGQRDDGIVTIDYDLCIGCAYCAVACPYQARFRVDVPSRAYGGDRMMRHEDVREQWDRRSVAQKCTLCVDRIDEGMARGLVPGVDAAATPVCVSSCIAGALQFGDLEDPDSNVSALLRDNRHFRMHEDLATGPAIHYLYDGDEDAEGPVPMLADPVGQEAVSPRLQRNWDWRAAANFIFGGTGAGLFAAGVIAALFTPVSWLASFIALALVGAGLFCVWLEIGRPWRFLNVFRNPTTSWMSREAMVAMPFFAFGALYLFSPPSILLPVVGLIAALFGVAFLYCQARIVAATKGIPAWRQQGIVPLMLTTGLTEGVGLLAVIAVLTGPVGPTMPLALVLLALLGARALAWRRYRAALGATGAPTATFAVLDDPWRGLSMPVQAAVVLLALIGLFSPPVLVLAGLGALASGWDFKFLLITRAAFNQGYAIDRMPAHGGTHSAPGLKPGWTLS